MEDWSMYRVGYPFWKTVVRHGYTVMLRVEIKRDAEAGVYVASSPDLDGLVVEAASLDELRVEALAAADALLELALNVDRPPQSVADFRMLERAHCAA
jgi:predicted RNase H-like HicB family nuclease